MSCRLSQNARPLRCCGSAGRGRLCSSVHACLQSISSTNESRRTSYTSRRSAEGRREAARSAHRVGDLMSPPRDSSFSTFTAGATHDQQRDFCVDFSSNLHVSHVPLANERQIAAYCSYCLCSTHKTAVANDCSTVKGYHFERTVALHKNNTYLCRGGTAHGAA